MLQFVFFFAPPRMRVLNNEDKRDLLRAGLFSVFFWVVSQLLGAPLVLSIMPKQEDSSPLSSTGTAARTPS